MVKTIPVDSIAEEVYVTSTGDTLKSIDQEILIPLRPTLTKSIKIVAVGDIMMGTNFPQESYLPPDSGNWLWRDVVEVLSDADITFGNLEGVILDEGGEQKECKNPKACYLFRTPTALTFHFQKAGFDFLSLANNHANDFGETGRQNTQRVLDSLGIAYAGAVEQSDTSRSFKRLRVGLLAVAPNKGTISIHDQELIAGIVEELDKENDFVIVSFHAGAEGAKNQHVTREREYYYGEDRGNVYEFAHEMIDKGADLLLGHGPHVPRAIEVYKDRLIAYSLGNFLTYGRFNLKGPNGEAPVLEAVLDNEGKFISGQIHSYYQDYTLGPRKDDSQRAMLRIKQLSEEDFPESPVAIDDTGRILYIQN